MKIVEIASRRGMARRARRGVVLVLVLIVIVFLSLSAYTFTYLMVTHRQAAKLAGRQVQARALADSGVAAVRMFLSHGKSGWSKLGGLWDNPDYFRGVVTFDDERGRGRFSVLSPVVEEDGSISGLRFGLEDESARINLNTLIAWDEAYPDSGREMLLGLPGMTDEAADSILDWLDEDEEPREFGAELSDYYSSLESPYAPANGPLQTVEELLKVRGVTPELLFGLDANRNRMLDESELEFAGENTTSQDGASLPPTGWSGYFTLYSNERILASSGLPRIDLNAEKLEQLHKDLLEALPPDQAAFIIVYRQIGPYREENEEDEIKADSKQGNSKQGDEKQNDPLIEISFDESGLADQLDFNKEGRTQLESVLDLIGAQLEIPDPDGVADNADSSVLVLSPFSADPEAMAEFLPLLMDALTTEDPKASRAGRINVNLAPRSILAGLPGMTEDIVENLLSRRVDVNASDEEDPAWSYATWMLSEGVVTLDEMRELLPLVNAGGNVFRAQIVGFFDDGQAASRLEVVIDATGPQPRLLSWRDISHLGRGYDLFTLGVDAMSMQRSSVAR